MRKITLLLALVGFIMGGVSQAQNTSGKLKGSGEVFFYESFDWGNPDDPRGWTQPDGYYMEDPTDDTEMAAVIAQALTDQNPA